MSRVFRLAKERQRRLHVRGVLGQRQGHVERRTENGIAEKSQRRVLQIARPVDVPGNAEHAGRHQSHGHLGHAVVGPQRQGRVVAVTRLSGTRSVAAGSAISVGFFFFPNTPKTGGGSQGK